MLCLIVCRIVDIYLSILYICVYTYLAIVILLYFNEPCVFILMLYSRVCYFHCFQHVLVLIMITEVQQALVMHALPQLAQNVKDSFM